MKNSDIIEALADCVESKIFKEWKHEGFIDQTFSNAIDVDIDGKHYIIELTEYEEQKNES